MTYGLDGFWSYLIPLLYFAIEGLYALFITGLGVYAIARGWGVRALSGLRLVGAGLALWGLTDLVGEFVWLLSRLFGLDSVFYDLLGSGLQRTGYAALDAWSALLAAISIGLVVVGGVSVARGLALGPDRLAAEADLPDEPAIDVPDAQPAAEGPEAGIESGVDEAIATDEPAASAEVSDASLARADDEPTAPARDIEAEKAAEARGQDPDAEATVVDTLPQAAEATDEVNARPTDPGQPETPGKPETS